MNHTVLYQWTQELATHLAGLNVWQINNIALFSQAIVEAESCQQSQIARKAACGEKVQSTERRFRRFLHNTCLPLETFFKQWTAWIMGRMSQKSIHLLVDETKLADQIGAMVVGVAWEGRCIPLAWRCYKANSRADYPIEGQVALIEKLLQYVKAGMPEDKRVIVLADRGIGTSPKLCQAVAKIGWYYLFRVQGSSKVVTKDGAFTLAEMVQPGQHWQAKGRVFKKRGKIPACAIALWTQGYDEPWSLVTNNENLTGWEYARRNWQEQSFRDLKSHGWQWESSRIHHPDHMDKLMLLLTVAYGWILSLGSYAVHWGKARPLQRHQDGTFRRYWSLFKEGLNLFVDYLTRYNVCLTLCFVPDKRLL